MENDFGTEEDKEFSRTWWKFIASWNIRLSKTVNKENEEEVKEFEFVVRENTKGSNTNLDDMWDWKKVERKKDEKGELSKIKLERELYFFQ